MVRYDIQFMVNILYYLSGKNNLLEYRVQFHLQDPFKTFPTRLPKDRMRQIIENTRNLLICYVIHH